MLLLSSMYLSTVGFIENRCARGSVMSIVYMVMSLTLSIVYAQHFLHTTGTVASKTRKRPQIEEVVEQCACAIVYSPVPNAALLPVACLPAWRPGAQSLLVM